jgi:uncharacterized repeat protein (TIGR02543 family)
LKSFGRATGSLLLSGLLAIASSWVGAAYDIPQSVIAGGGGTSAGAPYSITGTIGQGVTGYSAGGSYSVSGGFWGGGASTGAGSGITINLTINGSGSGSVASAPAGINCPTTCNDTFEGVPSVTLTATPTDAGSVFTGWLGACTGRSTCVINATGMQNVTATFAPNNAFALRLDADENAVADALTDGVMIVRYMLGLTDTALTNNALGINPGLTTGAAIKLHLDDIRPLLDIDGDGQVDALHDGLLLMRYLFGLRGPSLTANALSTGTTRGALGQIESYIQPLLP